MEESNLNQELYISMMMNLNNSCLKCMAVQVCLNTQAPLFDDFTLHNENTNSIDHDSGSKYHKDRIEPDCNAPF